MRQKGNVLLSFILFWNTALVAQSFAIWDSLPQINQQPDKLSFLKGTLKDAKVVALGESNHQAGTTFEAKTALIKYLHEHLGYDIIAFESGMYDCAKANEKLLTGKSTLSELFDGLFGVWWTEEVKELMLYIQQTQQTDHPLQIAGIDNQLLYYYPLNFLKPDISTFFDSLAKKTGAHFQADSIFYIALDQARLYSNTFKKLSVTDTMRLSDVLTQAIHKVEAGQLDTIAYFSLWKRICYNLQTDYRKRYFPDEDIRDSMMAQNTDWLIKNNPGKNVIIWAASVHTVYNTQYINDKRYQLQSLGTHMKKMYGPAYFSISFVPNQGTGGYKEKGILSYKIREAKNGSVEKYIDEKYACEFGLFSFRDTAFKLSLLNAGINKSKLFWRKEITMDVSQICDAVFYIKEMKIPKYKIDLNNTLNE